MNQTNELWMDLLLAEKNKAGTEKILISMNSF